MEWGLPVIQRNQKNNFTGKEIIVKGQVLKDSSESGEEFSKVRTTRREAMVWKACRVNDG